MPPCDPLDAIHPSPDCLVNPDPTRQKTSGTSSPLLLGTVALLLIAATGAQLLHMRRNHRLAPAGVRLTSVPTLSDEGKVARTNSVYLPPEIRGWHSTNQPITVQELDYLPRDTTYARRTYVRTSTGDTIHVNAVLMGTDRTSIHKPEYCLTGQGFSIEKRTHARVKIERPVPYELPVQRFDATISTLIDGRPGIMKAVFAFWFVCDQHLTADHGERMWLIARDLLLKGELQRWAFISYLTYCPPGGEDAAFEKISSLIAASVPEFQLTHPGNSPDPGR